MDFPPTPFLLYRKGRFLSVNQSIELLMPKKLVSSHTFLEHQSSKNQPLLKEGKESRKEVQYIELVYCSLTTNLKHGS